MKELTFDDLSAAVRLIKNGGLLAFPTETVYGLGVICDDKKAWERLNLTKKRPFGQPYTLMCASVTDIERYALVDDLSRRVIAAYMPGEITLVLKAAITEPKWVISSSGHIGLRVPDDERVRRLLQAVGRPMLVTSANKSGRPATKDAKEVIAELGDEIDGIIVGPAGGSLPSTVVRIDQGVTILREGKITGSDIRKMIEGGQGS